MARALRSGLASVLVGLMAAGPLALRARAEPVLQEVVKGNVSVTDAGAGAFDVDATNGSIGRYSSFDVAVDETVQVNLDVEGGSHLARITSADPTRIFGSLLSNGHVYLVNSAGVYFAPGSSFDGMGLHAVAGDIDESSFGPSSGLEGETRYTSLEGTVENLGRINAQVVDLVGQYVRNAGIIESTAGDGYFALVVGDDVTISRRTEAGRLGISVTIEGLAAEVIDRMGATQQPGLELDHSGDGFIDAAGGDVFAGARVGATLGAGDLVGAAIRYVGRRDGGGLVVPDTLTAKRVTIASDGFFLQEQADGGTEIAGAADVEVNGGIQVDGGGEPGEVRLCAGTPCYDADGRAALAETAAEAEPRAEVRFGADAQVSEGARLEVIQDRDLVVDAGVAAVLGGRDLDLRLQVSDAVDVDADLDAQRLEIHAGADGTGDLAVADVTLSAQDVSLRAGAGGEESAVSIATGAAFAGAGGAGSPDSFTLHQDADLTLDGGADGLATRLSDPDWALTVTSSGELAVEGDLQAASLELSSGAARNGDLRIGADEAPVTLAADAQTLRAGLDDGFGSSRVTLAGDAGFVSTDGTAAPQSFALEQEADLASVDGQLPTAESFAPEGVSVEDSLAAGIDLELRSHAGDVALDADAVAALAPLFARADLSLHAVDAVELGGDLVARALQVESGQSRIAGNVLATEGDAVLIGPTEFTADDADQSVVSDAGRVRLLTSDDLDASLAAPSLAVVAKRSGGDLVLRAGAADAPDARPIQMVVDVSVQGGDLAIESAFSTAGNLQVTAAEDAGGALSLATSGTFDGRFIEPVLDEAGEPATEDRARDQSVSAQTLAVASGAELVKTGGGELRLVGSGDVALDGSARVENTIGTTDTEGELVASALQVSGGAVHVGSAARASLAADSVVLRGATVAVGQVEIAAPDSLVIEQEAALTAASLPDPGDDAFAAGVPGSYTVRSTGAAVTVDEPVAARLRGLDTELTVDAALGLSVQADLDARELTLRSGSDPEAAEGDLVVGAEGSEVTLRADAQVLHAQGDTAAIDLSHALLRDTAGARAPRELTLRTDAGFDAADDVPELARLGDIPDGERMRYALQSDAGSVSVDSGLAARVAGAGIDLSLVAADDVAIDADLTAATVAAHAGTDGEGTLRIGAAETEGPVLHAAEFSLRAGDGTGDTAAVQVAESARLHQADGGAPDRFTLEQDAALADSDIPAADVFGGSVAGMEYTLRSHGGAVDVATRAKVAGTDLTLGGAAGVSVDLETDAPLVLGSLRVESIGAGAGASLGQSLVATDGDVAFETDLELTPLDTEIRADAGDVSVSRLATAGGGVTLTASGALVLNGDLDATGADGDGAVLLAAGDGIQVGPAGADGRLRIEGGDVTFSDAVTRAPEAGDPVLHDLTVLASGDASFGAGVEIDSLAVAAAGQVELQSGVATRRVQSEDVGFEGPRDRGASIDLAAGSGDLILSGVAPELRADDVSLAGRRLLLGDARLVGIDGGAPLDTSLRQAISVTDADALLAHLGESPGAELEGRGIGLHSDVGRVVLDAAEAAALAGTRLALGGTDLVDDSGQELTGVEVGGDLDVESLDLDSSAEIAGDLTVRAPSLDGRGLEAEGDLIVEGDLTLRAQGVFDGGGAQTVSAGGALIAPRLSSPVGSEPTALTLQAGGGLDLVGSFEDGRLVSVDAEGGFLTVDGDAAVAGDLRAAGDLALGGGVTLNGVGDQAIVSSAGSVRAEVDLVKSDAGVRRPGEASLELGGAGGFDVRGDVIAADDLTLVGARSLRLDEGGDTRRLEAVGGTLTLVGGTDDAGANAGVALELAGGSGLEVQDDATVVAREITVESAVRGSGALRLDVTGAGDAGRIELQDEVAIDPTGTLELRSDAIAGLELGAERLEAGSVLLNPGARGPAPRATIVRDGDLSIAATGGRFEMGAGEKLTVLGTLDITASESARVADLTALEIAVSAPRIELAGRAPGDVERPDGSTVRDLGTDIVANSIRFSSEPSGSGSFITRTGTDVSDTLDEKQRRALAPDGSALTLDDLVSQADGGALDATGTGAVLFETARELDVQIDAQEPLPPVVLAGLNRAAVGARPLWAEELVAYLETVSVRGAPLVRRLEPDPRFETAAVRNALRTYISLLAPTALFDEETGGRIVRSHRERIQAAFAHALGGFTRERPGESLTGPALATYVELEPDHSEALFYLGTLGDLVLEARRAGIADHEIDVFKRLLVRDLTPEGLPVETLADAIQ